MKAPVSVREASSDASGGPESGAAHGAPASLGRVLGLWDLVFYGIVLIQPVGGVGIYGIANHDSLGHVSLAIVAALVAMMLTAVSYGRMAGLYPVAGSAYAYVGRGLNPYLGFMAGWAMFLDYLVIPVISVVYGALTTQKLIEESLPGLTQRIVAGAGWHGDPQRAGFIVWAVLFVAASTLLNVRGMRWTARTNQVLTVVMFLVIALFVKEAATYIFYKQGWAGLFSTLPFYNPATFNVAAVGKATSLAALTYIGFDGITTLAEEVREPKRTVPLAVVLVCLIIGVAAVAETYLGQRAWPDYAAFKEAELPTAFFDVCRLVGGKFLFDAMTLTLVVASFGSALTGQVGAARILYGMGRDNALPRIFAKLGPRGNPAPNIWLLGAAILGVSVFLDYEGAADLINFGAFLAFIGVNAAVIREFCFRPPPGHKRNGLFDFVCPAAGLLFCAAIFFYLPLPAKKVGGCWCAAGLIYLAVKTRGFTRAPVPLDLAG